MTTATRSSTAARSTTARLLGASRRSSSTGTSRSRKVLDYSAPAVRASGSSAARPTSATTPSTGISRRAATRRRWSGSRPKSTRTKSLHLPRAARRSEPRRRDDAVRWAWSSGDRVIIYMPMIPEAVFAILACARIGAIHSVVFGGFAAASLAARIDDAQPKLMITADGGSRMGKVVPYKPLVDESIRLAKHPPQKVLICQPRPRPGRCRCVAGPRRRLADAAREAHECAGAGARGSNRTSRPTSSTPPAPPASRRACSATSAATRWRWPRR